MNFLNKIQSFEIWSLFSKIFKEKSSQFLSTDQQENPSKIIFFFKWIIFLLISILITISLSVWIIQFHYSEKLIKKDFLGSPRGSRKSLKKQNLSNKELPEIKKLSPEQLVSEINSQSDQEEKLVDKNYPEYPTTRIPIYVMETKSDFKTGEFDTSESDTE